MSLSTLTRLSVIYVAPFNAYVKFIFFAGPLTRKINYCCNKRYWVGADLSSTEYSAAVKVIEIRLILVLYSIVMCLYFI